MNNEADSTLTILIKTKVELAGAIAARDAIEKQIGAAKALGKDTGDLEEKFKRADAAIQSYAGQSNEAAGEVEKLELSHRELHHVIGELTRGVPVLGEALTSTLYGPLGLILAGTAAWKEYKAVFDELTDSLAGFQFPDMAEYTPHVSAAADEQERFAEALSHSAEKAASVEAGEGRITAAIEAQLKQTKELLQAQKTLDLARLEANKGNMGAGDYAAAKVGIENRYAAALGGAEQNAAAARITAIENEITALKAEATTKRTQAAGINAPSDSSRIEGEEKQKRAEFDKAQADVQKHMDNLEAINAYGRGQATLGQSATAVRLAYENHMNFQAAAANERSFIDSAVQARDSYVDFEKQKPQRLVDSARKKQLEDEANAAGAKATELAASLPAQETAANKQSAADKTAADTERHARDEALPGAADTERAAGIARAEALHQKVSDADKQFLDKFEQVMAAHGVNVDRLLAMLFTIAGTASSQHAKLTALETIVNDLHSVVSIDRAMGTGT